MTSSPTGLLLPRPLLTDLIAHLRSTLPNEGCGLLAVERERTEAGHALATHFYPGTNRDASPTRFTMDPTEVFDAFRDIGARGWVLGAIVHSHPLSPASPSPTDLREAFYPDALMLIVSFMTGEPRLSAWSVEPSHPGRGVVQVPIIQRTAP